MFLRNKRTSKHENYVVGILHNSALYACQAALFPALISVFGGGAASGGGDSVDNAALYSALKFLFVEEYREYW